MNIGKKKKNNTVVKAVLFFFSWASLCAFFFFFTLCWGHFNFGEASLIMLLLFLKVRIEENCLVRNDCQLRMLSVNSDSLVLESILLQSICPYQKIKLLGCTNHSSLDKFCYVIPDQFF